MLIDKEKCIRCGQCIPYCPMGCISKTDDGVAITPMNVLSAKYAVMQKFAPETHFICLSWSILVHFAVSSQIR